MNERLEAIKGNIIYAETPGELTVMPDSWIVTEGGIIRGIFGELPERYAAAEATDYGDMIITPSFTDLHLHAPQYSYCGTAMDLELLDWLQQYTYPEEAHYADPAYAKLGYAYFVRDLKNSATTRACIFATLHTDATLELMHQLRDAGLSAQKIQSAARLLEHAEQVRGKIDARDLFLQRRSENLRPQHDARAVRQDERGPVQDRAERLVMQGLIGHFGIRRHTVRGLGPLQQRPRRVERLRHGHIIILYAQNIRLHAHTSSIIVFVSFILPYLPALVYSRRAVQRAHFFPPRILWGKSGPARLYSAFN